MGNVQLIVPRSSNAAASAWWLVRPTNLKCQYGKYGNETQRLTHCTFEEEFYGSQTGTQTASGEDL